MSLQSSSVKIPLTSLRTRKCNFFIMQCFLMILCVRLFLILMSLKDQIKVYLLIMSIQVSSKALSLKFVLNRHDFSPLYKYKQKQTNNASKKCLVYF